MAFMAKLLGLGVRETADVRVSGEIHHFEPSPEFLARVAQNLRELHLPEPETPIVIDVPAVEHSQSEKPASHTRQVGDDLEEFVP